MDATIIAAILTIAGGAVVATGAAVYTVRAGRSRPKPHFDPTGAAPGAADLQVTVDNPGGEAAKCNAVAQVGQDFYEFRGRIAPGLQGTRLTMNRLGDKEAASASQVPIVHWVAARDSRGKWWDVQRGRRIRGRIDRWLAKKSLDAGLAIPVEMEPF
jgi:hypothetical protein